MGRKKLTDEELILLQVQEINKYRWLESEKAGCDIGSRKAAQEWIEKHAEDFRRHWQNGGNGDGDGDNQQ